MSDVPDPKQIEIVSTTLRNAHELVSAYDHLAHVTIQGFDLAACCAVVQLESGGRNIWGADPWDPRAYPAGLALPVELQEQPVTEDNYRAYRARRNRGCQPQGCGPMQLTSASYQETAEIAGGCWAPFYNFRTGFAILAGLFARAGTAEEAFASYNGSGPAATEYGERAEAARALWLTKLIVPDA